jgi:hypothetical protein
MTVPEFEQALHARGYTTRRYPQERMGTASLDYEWYTANLVDVLKDGVVVATYDELIIDMLFTPQNIGYELDKIQKRTDNVTT